MSVSFTHNEKYEFRKEDSQLIEDHSEVTPDFLAILSQNGIPKHELHLKQGCICSLMHNMSVQKELVKNARLIIQEVHHHYVEVRLINNRTGQLGDAQCIPRICFEFTPPCASWTVECSSSTISSASCICDDFQWLLRSNP